MTIYFAQHQTSLLIKIGCTKNVERRRNDLRRAFGPVTILLVVEGSFREERALHEKFKDSRVAGEWFSPSPALLAYIHESDGAITPARSPSTLGQMILSARKDKGWTTRELARRASVSAPYISQIESGHVKEPRLRGMSRLADALGLSIDAMAETTE